MFKVIDKKELTQVIGGAVGDTVTIDIDGPTFTFDGVYEVTAAKSEDSSSSTCCKSS